MIDSAVCKAKAPTSGLESFPGRAAPHLGKGPAAILAPLPLQAAAASVENAPSA